MSSSSTSRKQGKQVHVAIVVHNDQLVRAALVPLQRSRRGLDEPRLMDDVLNAMAKLTGDYRVTHATMLEVAPRIYAISYTEGGRVTVALAVEQ